MTYLKDSDMLNTLCPLCATSFNQTPTELYDKGILQCVRGHCFNINTNGSYLSIKHWPEFPHSAYDGLTVTKESIDCWIRCIEESSHLPYRNKITVKGIKNELLSLSLLSKRTPDLVDSFIRMSRHDEHLLKYNHQYAEDGKSTKYVAEKFETFIVELKNLKKAVIQNLKKNEKSLEDVLPYLTLSTT